jgi:hypothetical protein
MRHALLSSITLLLAHTALAQAPDVYSNMEGHWTGTISELIGGRVAKIPATMVVERDPKKPRLHIALNFEVPKMPADAAAPPPSSGRRGGGAGGPGGAAAADPVKDLAGNFNLELKPKSETMVRTSSSPENDFKTTGLAKFAETGAGSFVATGVTTLIDKTGDTRRWLVHVEPGVVEWEIQIANGSTWAPKADFQFRKDGTTEAK